MQIGIDNRAMGEVQVICGPMFSGKVGENHFFPAMNLFLTTTQVHRASETHTQTHHRGQKMSGDQTCE